MFKVLTDAQCRGAKGKDKAYKLGDFDGLFLYVTPAGHRSWRFRYRFAGKQKQCVLGSYPELTLKDARAIRDDKKRLLRDGKDPSIEAKREALAARLSAVNTFELLAREWHECQSPRWKPVHARDVIESLERDVFPDLGALPVASIDSPLILSTLKKVQARGAIETSHRLRQRISAIFVYGIATGRALSDPAASIGKALKPKPAGKRWPAVTKIDAARDVLRITDTALASPTTILASRFLAITAQRPGMIRCVRWDELHNVELTGQDECPEAIWCVPAAKLKQEFELREDEEFDHPVPLVKEAVDVLRASYSLNAGSPYVFPGSRSMLKPMSENALSYLYLREGLRRRHVPHGWRSSFSSLMNEWAVENGQEKDRLVIDLMLAHRPIGISATELKYNRAAFLKRRRELSEIWVEMLMKGASAAGSLLGGRRRRKA
jgi:hypothetical protein